MFGSNVVQADRNYIPAENMFYSSLNLTNFFTACVVQFVKKLRSWKRAKNTTIQATTQNWYLWTALTLIFYWFRLYSQHFQPLSLLRPVSRKPRYLFGLELKLCYVCLSFKNFENHTKKLSVKEAKPIGLGARNGASIQKVLPSGPKSYQAFPETVTRTILDESSLEKLLYRTTIFLGFHKKKFELFFSDDWN